MSMQANREIAAKQAWGKISGGSKRFPTLHSRKTDKAQELLESGGGVGG